MQKKMTKGYVLNEQAALDEGQTICSINNDYEKYIFEKYRATGITQITIKQGFVVGESLNESTFKRFRSVQRDVLQSVREQISSEINTIVNRAKDRMSSLTDKETELQEPESNRIYIQVNQIATDIFPELRDSIKKIIRETYKKVYYQSVARLIQTIEVPLSPTVLPTDIDKICPWLDLWLKKEKERLLKSIANDFYKLAQSEKPEKAFFLPFVFGILAAALFVSLTGCAERSTDAAEDAAYEAEVEGLKDSFAAAGAEKYEIIVNKDEKTCDICGERSEKVFSIEDFVIGDTAPPFHSNCRCTIERYSSEEIKEDEKPTVLISRDDIVLFANEFSKNTSAKNGWQNISQESVVELNAILIKYNITSTNEIRHFLAQCFIESWYGKTLIEINWNTYPDTSKDRAYFNNKYGDRTDLGNLGKDTDDGYNFRGAGYIQLTGRYNYQAFSDKIDDQKVMQGADYVAEHYAWEAAAHYWEERVQYRFSEGNMPTVSQITQDVNGGQNNLAERTAAYNLLSSLSE